MACEKRACYVLSRPSRLPSRFLSPSRFQIQHYNARPMHAHYLSTAELGKRDLHGEGNGSGGIAGNGGIAGHGEGEEKSRYWDRELLMLTFSPVDPGSTVLVELPRGEGETGAVESECKSEAEAGADEDEDENENEDVKGKEKVTVEDSDWVFPQWRRGARMWFSYMVF